MSAALQTLLNAVTASGAGAEHDLSAVDDYQGGQHSIEVSGISGDTVLIEGRIDTNWFTLGTFTADGLLTVPGVFKGIRGNVSVYSAGTITMKARYGTLNSNIASDLTTLLGRLSSARASLMDNLSRLDVNVSTRATSSTETDINNMVKQLRTRGIVVT